MALRLVLAFLILGASLAPAEAARIRLQTAVDGASGGVLNLNPADVYTGTAIINKNLVINGNGAMIDLNDDPAEFKTILVLSNFTMTLNNANIQGGSIGVVFNTNANGVLNSVSISSSGGNAIVHDGQGRLELNNCSIQNHQFGINANMSASPIVPGSPDVVVRNTTFRDVDFPISVREGLYDIYGCRFYGGQNGIVTPGGTGSASARSVVSNSYFEDIQFFGVNMGEGGFTDIRRSTFIDCVAADVRAGGDLLVQDCHLNASGITTVKPGVGIAVSGGARLEIYRTEIVKYLNSINADGKVFVRAEDCDFIEPYGVGINIIDETEVIVRRCRFIDTGSDAVFTALDSGGTPVPHSFGLIEDCFISGAGALEPNPIIGNTIREGTGMGFFGGTFTVRRCQIYDSYDLGLAALRDANITVVDSEIISNRLTGAIAENASLTMENTIVANQLGEENAGLTDTSEPGDVFALRRNLIAHNRRGIQLNNALGQTISEENLLVQNIVQGVSSTSNSTFEARRTGFIDTAQDYQVFFQNAGAATVQDSTIWGANLRGLYSQNSPTPNATSNWWGNSGPWNLNNGANPGGRMSYANAKVDPYRTETPLEIYYRGTDTSILSAGGGNWFSITAPAATDPAHTLIGAMRLDSSISGGTPTPAGTIFNEPIHLWTSMEWRGLPGEVEIRIQVSDVSSCDDFVRYDRATSTVLERIRVDRDLGNNLAMMNGPAELFQSGTWFFVDSPQRNYVDRLLGTGNSVNDSNSDGIFDCGDLVDSL